MSNGEFEEEPKDGRSGSGGETHLLPRFRGVAPEAEGCEAISVREILFVELLGGLGDVLISLGAIQALARSYPEARLTVLTFLPGGALLEDDPLIHEVVYAPNPDPTRPHCVREAVEGLLARSNWDLVVSDTSYDGIDVLIRNCGAPITVDNLWRGAPPPH